MAKVKIYIIILIPLVIIAMLILITLISQESEIEMKIAIYPTSTSDETYYFVLNDNGILKCSVGTQHNDSIKRYNFLKKVKNEAVIKLTEQQVQYIINMANELQASGYNSKKKMLLDAWAITMLYNNKVYEMNYWGNSSDIFKKLIDNIIKLSPVPVDLHSWA